MMFVDTTFERPCVRLKRVMLDCQPRIVMARGRHVFASLQAEWGLHEGRILSHYGIQTFEGIRPSSSRPGAIIRVAEVSTIVATAISLF